MDAMYTWSGCNALTSPRLTKAGTGRHQPRHPFLFWTALVIDRAYNQRF